MVPFLFQHYFAIHWSTNMNEVTTTKQVNVCSFPALVQPRLCGQTALSPAQKSTWTALTSPPALTKTAKDSDKLNS